jgi:hypothetical protein
MPNGRKQQPDFSWISRSRAADVNDLECGGSVMLEVCDAQTLDDAEVKAEKYLRHTNVRLPSLITPSNTVNRARVSRVRCNSSYS